MKNRTEFGEHSLVLQFNRRFNIPGTISKEKDEDMIVMSRLLILIGYRIQRSRLVYLVSAVQYRTLRDSTVHNCHEQVYLPREIIDSAHCVQRRGVWLNSRLISSSRRYSEPKMVSSDEMDIDNSVEPQAEVTPTQVYKSIGVDISTSKLMDHFQFPGSKKACSGWGRWGRRNSQSWLGGRRCLLPGSWKT